MDKYLIIIPILFPLLFGAILFFFPVKTRRTRNVLVEAAVILNSAISLWVIWGTKGSALTLFTIFKGMDITVSLDGLGMVFGTLISVLWPLATLFAFEYMTHEERENTFFALYVMTYGVTLGVAYAGNLVTMYLFYEMLTLVTIPLVMHTMIADARRAGRQYAYYSIGGAAFAFVGIIFISIYGNGGGFTMGGILDMSKVGNQENLLLLVYVITFLGFGVKAAVFPMHGWLLSAAVAPTPVTALLHAVAVVKSGVFAIMRLTYYCYGTKFLAGSWAQVVVMGFAIFTAVFGATMAVREVHFKRRLAYSTVSNLSYILMAVLLMSKLGLVAGLCHMVFHAFGKICAFFDSGAVMYKTGTHYIYRLDGLGRKMPVTFFTYLVAALSLTGVPVFAGFISKWKIVQAAFDSNRMLGACVVVALLYAAVMSAIYMLTVVVRAYFPAEGVNLDEIQDYRDPGWKMLVPLMLFAVAIVYMGLNSGWLIQFFEKTAAGFI